jgi:hypothetical protein
VGASSTPRKTVARTGMSEKPPVVGIDCEHDRDDPMAMDMVQALSQTYPGHSWFVVIKGGIVHIKDMDLHPDWGMALHYSQIKSDAADRKRQVLFAAGEFLERARKQSGRLELQDIKQKIRTTL